MKKVFPYLALAVVSAVIWCSVMNRWSRAAWQTPLEYTGRPENADVLLVHAWVKAAADGRFPLFGLKTIPELGAPFHAQWSDYPVVEKLLLVGTGLVAKVTGVFAAVNLACLFAHVLAAVSCYAAARWLKCSATWSFAGALVFGFARYGFAHEAHHLRELYFWHVPLGLVVCRWLAFQNGGTPDRQPFRCALAVGLVTGLFNVYYTNMFLQLALLSGAVAVLRSRQWRALWPAVAVCRNAIFAALLMNADLLWFVLQHGPNPGSVVRSYQGIENWGLKAVDLLMPFPEHRVARFGEWAESYFSSVLLAGERPPPAYLGLVGIAGLVWLGVVAVLRLVKSPPKPIPLEAGQTAWILSYATVGGLNAFIATFGFTLFRSTTRYSIFILAAVLLFVMRRVTTLELRWPVKLKLAAVAVVGIALWDQLPPRTSTAAMQATAQAVAADRAFTARLEQQLPANAMVFQLPVMEFPESPLPTVCAYDHFRPYLFSRHLRYSFGAVKGRPAPTAQPELWSADSVKDLESRGFAALYINRTGFNDNAEALLAALGHLGYTNRVEQAGHDLVGVFLEPSPNLVLPLRD